MSQLHDDVMYCAGTYAMYTCLMQSCIILESNKSTWFQHQPIVHFIAFLNRSLLAFLNLGEIWRLKETKR